MAALLGGALSCSLSLGAVAEGISLAGPKGEVKQVTIGPTSPKDTLWRLANAHKPEGATVYQTMVALYEANPKAFNANNLNSLEKGMMLTLPDSQTILAIDPVEAKRRATQDDRQWSGKPAKPASKAAPKPKTQTGPQTVTTPSNQPIPVSTAGQDEVSAKLAELSGQLDEQRRQSAEQIAQLRRDLGMSIDEMGAMLEQNELLKARLEELNGQIQVLQGALDDQQAVNRELEQQLLTPIADEPTGEVFEPVEEMEESGIWQQLWSKPWLVGIAGVVPTIFVLALIWLFLRRRAPEPDASIAQISDPNLAPVAEPVATIPDPQVADGSEGMDLESAIQLDPQVQEEDEPVQSLEELLQEHQSMEEPEVSLTEVAPEAPQVQGDDELLANMAMNELEPDIDTVMEELGVALDDTNDMVELSHEAPEVEPNLGEDEIDALLKGAAEEAEPQIRPELQPQPQDSVPEPPMAEPEAPLSGLDLTADESSLSLPDAQPEPSQSEADPEEGFIDIDKLLDESGTTEPNFEPYNGLDLDIGESDLSDLVGDAGGVDVDDEDGGFSAKLDLARAYIEIDDKDSAKALLKEVVEKGADSQKLEAQSLLDKM
ncbi:FimV/HubP family polar landmark protein [Ferrimonas futtsuensis]|uniref:FimV/HubP family polar landmark protein n=1 Tax=Ferrimonas futtsuensis TaxID=364764 RepID=UPI000429A3FA|nr:FimV/HubP family polar landmark protein [Ferrimonas futtsuensis]